jgi:hypothetical protein
VIRDPERDDSEDDVDARDERRGGELEKPRDKRRWPSSAVRS